MIFADKIGASRAPVPKRFSHAERGRCRGLSRENTFHVWVKTEESVARRWVPTASETYSALGFAITRFAYIARAAILAPPRGEGMKLAV